MKLIDSLFAFSEFRAVLRTFDYLKKKHCPQHLFLDIPGRNYKRMILGECVVIATNGGAMHIPQPE